MATEFNISYKAYLNSKDDVKFGITHDALEWWASRDYDNAALQTKDAGISHVKGKFHEFIIKTAFTRNPHYFDYPSGGLIVNTGTLIIKDPFSTRAYSDLKQNELLQNQIEIQKEIIKLFQNIFKKGQAVIFFEGQPEPETITGKELKKRKEAEISDDEKNANIHLLFRHIALQPTKEQIQTSSLDILNKVETITTFYNSALQKEAYLNKLKNLETQLGIKLVEEPVVEAVEKLKLLVKNLQEENVSLQEEITANLSAIDDESTAAIAAEKKLEVIQKNYSDVLLKVKMAFELTNENFGPAMTQFLKNLKIKNINELA